MESSFKRAWGWFGHANNIRSFLVLLLSLSGAKWAEMNVSPHNVVNYFLTVGIGFFSSGLVAWILILSGKYVWRISYPVRVSISPNGGKEVALLFHPFRKGVYTITGRLSGPRVIYLSPFTMHTRTT